MIQHQLRFGVHILRQLEKVSEMEEQTLPPFFKASNRRSKESLTVISSSIEQEVVF